MADPVTLIFRLTAELLISASHFSDMDQPRVGRTCHLDLLVYSDLIGVSGGLMF